MRYGSILAVVDGREGTQAVAGTAMALGQTFKCHVEWIHVHRGLSQSGAVAAGSMGPAAVWEPLILGDDSEAEGRFTIYVAADNANGAGDGTIGAGTAMGECIAAKFVSGSSDKLHGENFRRSRSAGYRPLGKLSKARCFPARSKANDERFGN